MLQQRERSVVIEQFTPERGSSSTLRPGSPGGPGFVASREMSSVVEGPSAEVAGTSMYSTSLRVPAITQKRVLYGVLIIITVVFLSASARYLPFRQWSGEFLLWIEGLGWYGPIVFTLSYGVMTVGCLPILPLTLASGLLFGVVLGTLYSWAGAVLGGCLAFILGRFTFSTCARRMADSYPNFVALQRAISQNGWKMVFFLRLSPLIPFNMMSYALSITDVSFLSYASATALGILLPTSGCVYVGSAAGSVNDIIHNPSKSSLTLLVGGAVLTLFSVLVIASMSAKLIQQELRRIRASQTVHV